MPSPVPLPKHLRRVMISFRVMPAIKDAIYKHVRKTFRSGWMEQALIEKLEREGVKVDIPEPEENDGS